jgi:hypothetical protein
MAKVSQAELQQQQVRILNNSLPENASKHVIAAASVEGESPLFEDHVNPNNLRVIDRVAKDKAAVAGAGNPVIEDDAGGEIGKHGNPLSDAQAGLKATTGDGAGTEADGAVSPEVAASLLAQQTPPVSDAAAGNGSGKTGPTTWKNNA